MKRIKRKFLSALVYLFIFLLAVGTSLVIIEPSPDDAKSFAVEHSSSAGGMSWKSSSVYGGMFIKDTYYPNVSEEDFLKSFDRDVPRHSTKIVPVPMELIDPNDPYVQGIAQYLDELTEGRTQFVKACVALHFVQTGICYESDSRLYGCSEWWASPVETLYMQRGDCEDKAVLYISICLAMDIDCEILDYDGHIDAAVRPEGYSEYMLCMVSANILMTPRDDFKIDGEYPDIYPIGSLSSLRLMVGDSLAWAGRFRPF